MRRKLSRRNKTRKRSLTRRKRSKGRIRKISLLKLETLVLLNPISRRSNYPNTRIKTRRLKDLRTRRKTKSKRRDKTISQLTNLKNK